MRHPVNLANENELVITKRGSFIRLYDKQSYISMCFMDEGNGDSFYLICKRFGLYEFASQYSFDSFEDALDKCPAPYEKLAAAIGDSPLLIASLNKFFEK